MLIALPNNKILDLTKMKALADNKIYVTKMMISFFDRVENIVGKGGNACYQYFLLYVFKMFSYNIFSQGG